MNKKPIIAITGSSGKTTTKEMLASILNTQYKTFKSIANGNDAWYTSQYKKIIKSSDYEAIVLEYGLSKKGDITECCQLIQPNIGIVTNVDYAHIVNFNSNITDLALGKSELISGMKNDGHLFINNDDEYSKLLNTKSFTGKIITIGLTKASDYYASNIIYTIYGMQFSVFLKTKEHQFFIPSFGVHNVYNALFAIAAADILNISATKIAEGLKTYERPLQRLSIYEINKAKIIDDTYNAKPKSFIYALDVLNHIGRGKIVLICGPMIGLGEFSEAQHKLVGKHLSTQKIDSLCVLGDETKFIAQGAVEENFLSEKIHYFNERKTLYIYLADLIKQEKEITFLIKGAQKTREEWRTYSIKHYLSLLLKSNLPLAV
jgi:UDP-N-acetylmuramoyl-tripeptide--D-alanyl-D-alanine ligase